VKTDGENTITEITPRAIMDYCGGGAEHINKYHATLKRCIGGNSAGYATDT
jgi:hypothetical protein